MKFAVRLFLVFLLGICIYIAGMLFLGEDPIVIFHRVPYLQSLFTKEKPPVTSGPEDVLTDKDREELENVLKDIEQSQD